MTMKILAKENWHWTSTEGRRWAGNKGQPVPPDLPQDVIAALLVMWGVIPVNPTSLIAPTDSSTPVPEVLG
jgi:hypothetical protein